MRINIPEAKLADVVRFAYDNSRPAGMGMLHYQEGPLPEHLLERIIKPTGRHAVRMDYVLGRCCKFDVYRDDSGQLYTDTEWYDHSEDDSRRLVQLINGPS